MRKKLLAVIAAAAMAVTMMPAMVFATGMECEAGANCNTHKAAIGGQHYASIRDALNAVQDGETITMLNNETVQRADGKIELRKNITLDLGGYTLTEDADGQSMFEVYSNLTVKNGKILLTNGKSNSAMWLNEDAKVVIEKDATISTSDSAAGFPSYAIGLRNGSNGAKLTIKGSITGESGITINGMIENETNEIVIEDGAKINVTNTAIYLAGNGKTTIGAADISGNTGIEIRAGKLTVNGATVEGKGTPFSVDPNGNGTTTGGAALAVVQHVTDQNINVNINNGTFTATADDGYAIVASNPQENENVEEKVNITVNGGVFDGIVANNTNANANPTTDLGASLWINKGILKKEYSIAGDNSGFNYAEDVVDVDYITYVGNDLVADALKNATKDSEIYVYNDVDGKLVVPAGAKVYNFTGNTLNINGTDYEYEEPSADEELKPIVAPEAKAPEEQKPEKSPETGDESNMAVPFAAAGLALAAMAAAVAARRRHN